MVECQLPKLNVASSSLVTRSKKIKSLSGLGPRALRAHAETPGKGFFVFSPMFLPSRHSSIPIPSRQPTLSSPNPVPLTDTFQLQSRPANLYNLPLTRPAGRHCLQKNRQDTYKVCLITRPNRQTSTKPETYRQKSAEKPTKNRQENILLKLI